MGVLNIREAERAGSRLVIGISGVSGSGKTFSALQLAWGLAGGDAKKVGLLDTENKRGSLYADSLRDKNGKVHKFLIGDLYAPFSPQRYIDAILEFQAAGVEVLVIDSVSHEWAGLGGVLHLVNQQAKSITGWKMYKPEHQRFMNTMLQCDMHIIVCIRAANKTDWSDPKNPKSLGFMPIQQEEFMFEMTASMMMWDGGKSRQVLKCPAELASIFGNPGEFSEGYLTARNGLALREWVSGGAPVDGGIEHAINTLRTMSERGMDALMKCWEELPPKTRKALGDNCPDDIVASAQAFDEQRSSANHDAQDVDDLNSAVMGTGAQ